MAKAFSLGILVGRFQMIHAGHQQMIQTALNTCDEVGIFVGSSQESGTEKNPFTYELREKLLRTLFGDKVHIYPLPDIGVGNNGTWGDYVLQNVEDTGIITGNRFESNREKFVVFAIISPAQLCSGLFMDHFNQ